MNDKKDKTRKMDYSRARREIELRSIPSISWPRWAVYFAVSVAAGIYVHGCISRYAYENASEVASHTQATFADNWEKSATPGESGDGSAAAALMLRHLGMPADSLDAELLDNLEEAFGRYRSSAGTPPGLVIAARLLGPGQSTSGDENGCEEDIIGSVAGALGRQLLGWPSSTKDELQGLLQFRQIRSPSTGTAPSGTPPPADSASTTEMVQRACAQFRDRQAPAISVMTAGLARTAAKPANELAERILGADACLPGGSSSRNYNECVLLRALFSATLNAEDVRDARLGINFIWGWERAAVLALAFQIVLAMGHLFGARKPLEKQANWLAVELQMIDSRLSPNNANPPVMNANQETHNLHRNFYDKFGKAGAPGTAPPFEWKGGLTVLRDIVDASEESSHTDDRTHLEKFVELHTQALARQRAFINALVTAFPAIGLVATLNGLIHALSRASGIVAGTEAERFANTELVTGVLSSSFATTLIALVFMAVCMLINVREEHREAELLETTHKRLLAVFWPGRAGAPGTSSPPPTRGRTNK
jgi:hypothetical protein